MIRTTPRLAAMALLAPSLLCPSLLAQPTSTHQGPGILNAEDEAHRAARIALTGDLGFPPLPAVTADSPRTSIYWADRVPVGQGPAPSAAEAPRMQDLFIPAGEGGTGTPFPEIAKLQVPVDYDGGGDARPLLVALHGFGFSANSVASQSTLDEECNVRGWFYLAPTGIDDQLFGPPIAQQNISAAIQHVLDTYLVDPDRIYMAGFSMGGGIAVNYAARHRDPDGIMIAAVGSVSATLDWAQEYSVGTPSLQSLMEHQYNFDGDPTTRPFAYRQASGAVFSGYLPLPGLLDGPLSMATNVAGLPVYITYDVNDTIAHVPGVNDALEGLFVGLGADVQKRVRSGTVNPDFPWIEAPHSWAVLDEDEMCDMFAAAVVDRRPAAFAGQLDLGADVSWVSATQARADEFSYVDGAVDVGSGSLALTGIANVASLRIDTAAAGVAGYPVRVTASSVDLLDDTTLTLADLPAAPSYLLDAVTGALVTGVDSDPAAGTLSVVVPAGATLDVEVVHDPRWTTSLTTTPNPVPRGDTLQLAIDAPSTSVSAWWVFSVAEALTVAKSAVMTASPAPPAILVYLPLDGNGDVTLPLTVPNDPSLADLRLPWQTLSLNGLGAVDSVSNLWGFRIE